MKTARNVQRTFEAMRERNPFTPLPAALLRMGVCSGTRDMTPRLYFCHKQAFASGEATLTKGHLVVHVLQLCPEPPCGLVTQVGRVVHLTRPDLHGMKAHGVFARLSLSGQSKRLLCCAVDTCAAWEAAV